MQNRPNRQAILVPATVQNPTLPIERISFFAEDGSPAIFGGGASLSAFVEAGNRLLETATVVWRVEDATNTEIPSRLVGVDPLVIVNGSVHDDGVFYGHLSGPQVPFGVDDFTIVMVIGVPPSDEGSLKFWSSSGTYETNGINLQPFYFGLFDQGNNRSADVSIQEPYSSPEYPNVNTFRAWRNATDYKLQAGWFGVSPFETTHLGLTPNPLVLDGVPITIDATYGFIAAAAFNRVLSDGELSIVSGALGGPISDSLTMIKTGAIPKLALRYTPRNINNAGGDAHVDSTWITNTFGEGEVQVNTSDFGAGTGITIYLDKGSSDFPYAGERYPHPPSIKFTISPDGVATFLDGAGITIKVPNGRLPQVTAGGKVYAELDNTNEVWFLSGDLDINFP